MFVDCGAIFPNQNLSELQVHQTTSFKTVNRRKHTIFWKCSCHVSFKTESPVTHFFLPLSFIQSLFSLHFCFYLNDVNFSIIFAHIHPPWFSVFIWGAKNLHQISASCYKLCICTEKVRWNIMQYMQLHSLWKRLGWATSFYSLIWKVQVSIRASSASWFVYLKMQL